MKTNLEMLHVLKLNILIY